MKISNYPVIVLGSGISSLGAIDELISKGIKPLVIDIGNIITPRKKDKNNTIICGKSWYGNYEGYSIYDKNNPFRIKSKRLCSSHQYGGYGAVWTGSFFLPFREELNINDQEYKDLIFYAKIFQDKYTKLSDISFFESREELNNPDIILKKARIAICPNHLKLSKKDGTAPSSISQLGPIFNPALILKKYIENNLIDYHGNSYVVSINNNEKKITLFKDNKLKNLKFEKIYVCCGCINSLYLAANHIPQKKYFEIKIAPSINFPLISFRKRNKTKTVVNQNYYAPVNFLIIRKVKGIRDSIYCQISNLNLEILEKANIPKFLRNIINFFSEYIYIAQLRLSSKNSYPFICKIDSFKNIEDPGCIDIKESKRKLKKFVLIKSFITVSSFLKKRGMFTNILFIWIYKLITKSDFCGWHISSNLATKIEDKLISDIYFIDSASLGEVPATTIVPILYGRSRALVNYSFDKKITKIKS